VWLRFVVRGPADRFNTDRLWSVVAGRHLVDHGDELRRHRLEHRRQPGAQDRCLLGGTVDEVVQEVGHVRTSSR
jgi:hypothetical protein